MSVSETNAVRTAAEVAAGHGARPVTVQAMAEFQRAVAVGGGVGSVLPVLAPRAVRATPLDPAEIEAFIGWHASRLASAVPVLLTGVDGSAGRTTLARGLARQAGQLLGPGEGVAVDGVSVWGRLTREVDQWATVTVADAAAASWVPRRGADNGLSVSAGAATLPAHRPAENCATPGQVLEAVSRLRTACSVIAVDTAADPAGGVAAALAVVPDAVVVVVSTGTEAGVWAARQVVQHYEHTAQLPRHRLIVALRGVSRRWPDTARASAQQLVGAGIEVLEIPYAAGFTETRPPAAVTATTTRLLAAVLARGPLTTSSAGPAGVDRPSEPGASGFVLTEGTTAS